MEEMLALLTSTLFGPNFLSMITFALGLLVFVIFVWHFHRYVGTRDVFKMDSQKYDRSGSLGKFLQKTSHLVKYIVVYPVLVFIWFGIFAAFMFVLGGDGFQAQTILTVSFGLVLTVRVCSYYKEELAIEIAKIIPFSIFATLILQPSIFNFDVIQRVLELGSFMSDIFVFMVFSVVAEWIIRILWSIKRRIFPDSRSELRIEEKFGR